MAETIDIRELNERIERQSAFVTNLTTGMDQIIVGQKHLVESLLIGLLSDGHVLLEGVPGLAKTLAIKTLASPDICGISLQALFSNWVPSMALFWRNVIPCLSMLFISLC